MTDREMWQEFCMNSDVAGNTQWESFKFCGGGPMADELAGLVLDGIKTATAGIELAYRNEKAELPKVGDYSIVLFDNDAAACIIRANSVSVVPFSEVNAEHAFKEGEGNRSLEDWKKMHKEFFSGYYKSIGREFDEKELCVLEEFEIVYKSE